MLHDRTFVYASALAACCVLFSACSGGGADATLQGDIFRASLGSDPETFDPAVMTGSIEGKVAYQIYEGLISPPAGDGDPVPGVAERWETSEDGLTWTFHLRSNARWSNGDPVVAEDFRQAWLRIARGDVAADYISFIRYIKHAHGYEIAGRALRRHPWLAPVVGVLEAGVGVRAPDPRTLIVDLQSPTPFFADIAMFYTLFPVHRGTIAEFGQNDAFRAENIVTNGPFQMHQYLRRNRIELKANPNYWDAANVHLDGVVMPIIEDASARITAFNDGRVHWADDPPNDQLAILSASPAFRSAEQLGTYYYRFNVTDPTLSDVRVRRALSFALNRAELCRCTLDSLYTPPTGFVAPLPNYPGVDGIGYDPGLARELLAEAGYPNGEGFPELEILYNTSENHRTIAQFVQDQWQTELGINVVLINQEWKVYLDTMEALDYQVARSGWIGDYVDPNTFLELWRTGDGNNRTGFANAEFDDLVSRSLRETDPARRVALQVQAEQLLVDEMPMTPVYYYSQFHMVEPMVQGWEMNVRNVHLTRWISLGEGAE